MWTDYGHINGPFNTYKDILRSWGVSDSDILILQVMWNEPHRVYHNQEHLEHILNLVEDWKKSNPNDKSKYEQLVMTAFFHDAVYDPRSTFNEEDSAILFSKMIGINEDRIKADNASHAQVFNMILDTKDHTKEPSASDKDLSRIFLEFDIHNLIYGSISDMIEIEKKLFREFGFVDFAMYKEVRGTKFLDKFVPHIKKIFPHSQVDAYAAWFKGHTPRIAVFAGTFFPFHKGHYDVLKKAERMFDKVILLTCINPQKSNDLNELKKYVNDELSKKLPNNQVEVFEGMLHQYVQSKNYPLTVVKGLRNPSDFDDEKLQLRYMEDLYPDINIVYIVSDRKYEHYASSGVKVIKSFGLDEKANDYLY